MSNTVFRKNSCEPPRPAGEGGTREERRGLHQGARVGGRMTDPEHAKWCIAWG
jgi:hypothetical protein